MPDASRRLDRYGARPADELTGRAGELARLRAWARLVPRGLAPPLIVRALPGAGRSELLRQAAVLMATEADVLPVLISCTACRPDTAAALVGQAMERALMAAYPNAAAAEHGMALVSRDAPQRMVTAHLAALPDTPGALATWITGLAACVGEQVGRPLALLLDDAQRIEGHQDLLRALLAPIPGPYAPGWVVALPIGSSLPEGGAEELHLPPLADPDDRELLVKALRAAGVSHAAGVLDGAALLDGLPTLIWGVAVGLRLSGQNRVENLDDLLRFLARETGDGFLAAYYSRLLGVGSCRDEERLALETVLHLATQGAPAPADARSLSAAMLRTPEEIAAVLETLERRGTVERRYGVVSLSAPAGLVRYCRSQWRRWVESRPAANDEAMLAWEDRRRVESIRAGKDRRRNVAEMGKLLESWRGQTVARSLFDHRRFEERCGAKGSDPGKGPAPDRSRLVLPRVERVWSEDFAGTAHLPACHVDLLGCAAPAQGERPLYLALDLRLDEAEVTTGMVEDFDRRCRLAEARYGLRRGELVAWVVSGGGFSVEAWEALARLRFWSSSPRQLAELAQALDLREPLQLALAPAPAEAATYALEMTIPARSETELVAARALQQMAEGLDLGEREVGQIKMALVEACLNAFEHGGSEDRNVYLTFRVSPQSLEIDVFNRGLPFMPGRIATPTVEEKLGSDHKRGWGLSLIRDLMDEAEFLERSEGTLLRMKKYLQPAAKEGRRGEAGQ